MLGNLHENRELKPVFFKSEECHTNPIYTKRGVKENVDSHSHIPFSELTYQQPRVKLRSDKGNTYQAITMNQALF